MLCSLIDRRAKFALYTCIMCVYLDSMLHYGKMVLFNLERAKLLAFDSNFKQLQRWDVRAGICGCTGYDLYLVYVKKGKVAWHA